MRPVGDDRDQKEKSPHCLTLGSRQNNAERTTSARLVFGWKVARDDTRRRLQLRYWFRRWVNEKACRERARRKCRVQAAKLTRRAFTHWIGAAATQRITRAFMNILVRLWSHKSLHFAFHMWRSFSKHKLNAQERRLDLLLKFLGLAMDKRFQSEACWQRARQMNAFRAWRLEARIRTLLKKCKN